MSDFGFGGTFDPLADAVGSASDGLDLRTVLLDAGVPRDDVDRAAEEGTLELLAFERMVSPELPQYSRRLPRVPRRPRVRRESAP